MSFRIESLKLELDNNEDQFVKKVNKFIRSHAISQKITKGVLLNISDHRKNQKLKLN